MTKVKTEIEQCPSYGDGRFLAPVSICSNDSDARKVVINTPCGEYIVFADDLRRAIDNAVRS